MSLEPDNYCDKIFHGLYVQRSWNNQTKIAPCCVAGQSEPKELPIDFVNDKYLKKLRQNTKNNLRNTECNFCWKYEDNNQVSKRSEKFTNTTDDPSVILGLDYNTLPICNAKCIICGPKFSSSWIEDSIKLKKKGYNSKFMFYDASIKEIDNKKFNHDGLDLSQLEILYFNGGEPLLTNDHIDVLSRIKDLENVNLRYNSNGSIYPSNEVLEYWNKTKTTTIWFSIDAVGDQFNYVRFPLEWEEVKSNIIRLHNEQPKINVCLLCTIGIHNVFEIEKVLDWFYNDLIQAKSADIGGDNINNQALTQLALGDLDLRYVDEKVRIQFINKLESIDKKYHHTTNYIIDYLKSTIEPPPNIIWNQYFDHLDSIRSTNWRETFPELANA